MTLLHPGDAFPSLSLELPHGDTLDLPGALAGDFGVVLVYRGAWCPYCVAQLESFERSLSRLGDAGARVVALSADDEAATLE
jgi:peroxiredoxin